MGKNGHKVNIGQLWTIQALIANKSTVDHPSIAAVTGGGKKNSLERSKSTEFQI